MEKKNDVRSLLRKAGAKHGIVTQKMINFRCDLENIEWLQSKPNKGRYINELIAKDRAGK